MGATVSKPQRVKMLMLHQTGRVPKSKPSVEWDQAVDVHAYTKKQFESTKAALEGMRDGLKVVVAKTTAAASGLSNAVTPGMGDKPEVAALTKSFTDAATSMDMKIRADADATLAKAINMLAAQLSAFSTDKARFDEHAGKILDVEYYQHRVTLLEGKPDVTKLQKKKDRLANGEALLKGDTDELLAKMKALQAAKDVILQHALCGAAGGYVTFFTSAGQSCNTVIPHLNAVLAALPPPPAPPAPPTPVVLAPPAGGVAPQPMQPGAPQQPGMVTVQPMQPAGTPVQISASQMVPPGVAPPTQAPMQPVAPLQPVSPTGVVAAAP